MKKPGNRERILEAAVEMFNQHGVGAVTTNHIAKNLGISIGNLYFHYSSKEDIIHEIFKMMAEQIDQLWNPELTVEPIQFVERSFEIFWNYRFFHREMYALRRGDKRLSTLWKRHLSQSSKLLKLNYQKWIERGFVKSSVTEDELQIIHDVILMSSNVYLGFFESPEKPASRTVQRLAIHHVNGLLTPYFTTGYQQQLVQ